MRAVSKETGNREPEVRTGTPAGPTDPAQIGAGDHLTVRQRSLVLLLAPYPVLTRLTNQARPGSLKQNFPARRLRQAERPQPRACSPAKIRPTSPDFGLSHARQMRTVASVVSGKSALSHLNRPITARVSVKTARCG